MVAYILPTPTFSDSSRTPNLIWPSNTLETNCAPSEVRPSLFQQVVESLLTGTEARNRQTLKP